LRNSNKHSNYKRNFEIGPYIYFLFIEIEEQVRNIQGKRKKLQDTDEVETQKVGLGSEGHYDTDIYSTHSKFEGYVTSIAPNEELDVRLNFVHCIK
jgi:hypothetical protein